MLSQSQRTTILELQTQGVSKRQIAQVLGISRQAVRRVLRSNSSQVPELHRPEKAEPYRPQILELFATCKGNLVRVHEELTASGAVLSYPALTAFCRRHGIGQAPPCPPANITLRRARRCSMTPRPTTWNWLGRSARCKPPRRCCATRGCCFSSATPAFSVLTARCFLPTPCVTSRAPQPAS